jgi:hypothetical protein
MVVSLGPGFYINLFEISVPKRDIEIMVSERSKYPNLREFREEIEKGGKEVFLYSPERSDKVYGYGNDMSWLSGRDFSPAKVNLYDEPRLTARMVLDGVIKKAKELGYSPIFSKDKGRCTLFNQNEFKASSNGQVRVYMGYDIRLIFLRDPLEDKICFGLIVDVTYSLRNIDDQPLNYQAITSSFGSATLKEVRQIQRDLIPTGVNTEVSRERLLDYIIPFVQKVRQIESPGGFEVEITSNPSRTILGGLNESIL